MGMMMQNLNFQEGGAGGSVAAGTAAGGGLPTNTAIATLSLSLALVPLGLIAAAVFPPFDPLKYVYLYPAATLKSAIEHSHFFYSAEFIQYILRYFLDLSNISSIF